MNDFLFILMCGKGLVPTTRVTLAKQLSYQKDR